MTLPIQSAFTNQSIAGGGIGLSGQQAPGTRIARRPFLAAGVGNIQNQIPPQTFVGTANQTGASSTLQVTAITSGQLVVGSVINGPGVVAGTTVTATPVGGGVGNYTVNNTTGFTSALITAIGPGGPVVAISTVNPLSSGLQYSPFFNSGQPYIQGSGSTGSVDLSFCSIMRGGNPSISGTTAPDNSCVNFNTVTALVGGNLVYNGGNSIQVGVIHSGLVIVLVLKGLGTNITAKVNDQYVSIAPTLAPNNATLNYYSLTFPTAQMRRIDFIVDNLNGGFKFGGFFVGVTDTLYPAPIRGPRVLIMGDSFTTATGAGSTALGFPGVFGEYLGFDDIWQSGVGGTGLLNPGSVCTYQQRVLTDVIPFAPDEVIIQGFFNDNAFNSSQIQTALTLLIQTILSNLPACRITIIGPYVNTGSGNHGGDPGFMGTRNACTATVASFGTTQVRYMDPTTGPAPALPQSTILTSAAAVGATTITTNNVNFLTPGCTYQWPDGTRSFVISRAAFVATVDRVPRAWPAGTPLFQVGNCYLRGAGFSGSPTGIGNADNLVFTDDVHPSPAGHIAMGIMLASLYVSLLNS